MVQKNFKRVRETEAVAVPAEVPVPVRSSDDPPSKKPKWTNRQRVLTLGSRGLIHRFRHLMLDMRSLMPHCKAEGKNDTKNDLRVLNEIAEMENCNKCLYFECRKRRDLYMWVASTPNGPSVNFQVTNIHTMSELKFAGNCLKGTRPFVCFDDSFDAPHLELIKELFTQVFSTPNHHPKSQPFFDHVITFTVIDDKIWFRNFQIMEEDGQLTEVGPRFVLTPIKVFAQSFGGATIWSNSAFTTPNTIRAIDREAKKLKYIDRHNQRVDKIRNQFRQGDLVFKGDPLNDVFSSKGEQVEYDAYVESEEEEPKPKLKNQPRSKKALRKIKRQKEVYFNPFKQQQKEE